MESNSGAQGAANGAWKASEPRYILITQCLQNDFFLNQDCRLCLPPVEVRKVLLGARGGDLELTPQEGLPRSDRRHLATGPLGEFLKTTVGNRRRGVDSRGTLHVINIRDWHEPGPHYDLERRLYGAHCERGTWGAEYIRGLEEWLDPSRPRIRSKLGVKSRAYSEGSVRIYHVYSDSLFDFSPHSLETECTSTHAKYRGSDLEDLLDVIMFGKDDQVEQLVKAAHLASQVDGDKNAVRKLADEVNRAAAEDPTADRTRVYVAVIGVYTDIKVKTLLTGIRSRYEIENLAVSDTLTASPTLERHLGALDFMAKVLRVEVIHGINDLAYFMGGTSRLANEDQIVAADRFSSYSSYFQDKQNVLAYEVERLREYLRLTRRRSEVVYRTIQFANTALLVWGLLFLLTTLAGVILNMLGLVDWQIPTITGGLSLLQLVTYFIRSPMKDLNDNLKTIATFRMILESHSLKTALARFHLTTPQTLRDDIDEDVSNKQVAALSKQIDVIAKIEAQDYQAIRGLGLANVTPPDVEEMPAQEPAAGSAQPKPGEGQSKEGDKADAKEPTAGSEQREEGDKADAGKSKTKSKE